MRTIIPMVGIAIVLIIVIVITQSGSIITGLSNQTLSEDAESEAYDISQEVQKFEGQCDAMLDIAIDAGITDPDELAAVLAKSATINEHATSGIYGTFDDETYFDASGWVPDADYVPTERSWYTEGQAHETFLPGEPYVDEESGNTVVSFSRTFTLSNGKSGVMAIDFHPGRHCGHGFPDEAPGLRRGHAPFFELCPFLLQGRCQRGRYLQGNLRRP